MTYYDFLMQFLGLDSAFGDLARDVKEDLEFPKASSERRIKEYFEKTGASESVRAVFKESFKHYNKGNDCLLHRAFDNVPQT